MFDASTGTPQAAKAANGLVTLEGVISGGSTTGGTVVATLPVGYRPAKLRIFTVSTSVGWAKFQIGPTGGLAGTNLDAAWTSLDGIVFRVD